MEGKKSGGIIAIVVAALVLVGGAAWFMMKDDNKDSQNNTNSSQQESTPASNESQQNIVELASATPSSSTLVSAVEAAGLASTLQGEGPFTVFAPTNEAFEALPEGTLTTLLKPENKQALADVLTYHVVAGDIKSSDLKDGQKITTLQGGMLTVKIADGKVYIVDAKGNEAMVVTADIDAENGVVHIIDGVLLQ